MRGHRVPRAEAIARLEGFRLAAVADADPARARAIAERFGAAVEADWKRLVRRSDLDGVIVSTPPPLHAPGNVWGFAGCEGNAFALLRSPVGKVASLKESWSEWRGYRFWIEI